MILAANSNLVSGLYIIFSETILVILAFAIHTYICTSNLRTLYNRKEPLRLTTVRLCILADYGITSRKKALLMSFFGGCALILNIIGSFAIDGRSRTQTKFVNTELLFTANWSEDVIDFTKHISPDGLTVSRIYELSQIALRCRRIDQNTSLQYSVVGSLDDTDSHKETSGKAPNVTCTFEENGFVNGDQIHDSHIQMASDQCLNSVQKPEAGISEDSFEKMNMTLDNDSCGDMKLIDTWCARFVEVACASTLRNKEGYGLLLRSDRSAVTLGPWQLANGIPVQGLQSAAYLMATGLSGNFGPVMMMSRMSMKQNTTVEVKARKVSETIVWVPLILCTTGWVVVVTCFMSVFSFWARWQYVVRRGLRGKNAFNSATDLFQLAAQITLDEEQLVSYDEVTVGIYGDDPRVGPVLATKIGSPGIPEDAIEGRLRQQTKLELTVEEVEP